MYKQLVQINVIIKTILFSLSLPSPYFEKATRFTLDLSVIPILREKTHLPIVIDPSHATGDWKLIEPASLAAIAAGADGLIIEVHDNPEKALSDGAQSLKPKRFAELITKARKVAQAVGREI